MVAIAGDFVYRGALWSVREVLRYAQEDMKQN
jgi:hypothetical protein